MKLDTRVLARAVRIDEQPVDATLPIAAVDEVDDRYALLMEDLAALLERCWADRERMMHAGVLVGLLAGELAGCERVQAGDNRNVDDLGRPFGERPAIRSGPRGAVGELELTRDREKR